MKHRNIVNWRAFGPIMTALALAVVIMLINANVSFAQDEATSADAGPMTCRVNTGANLRAGPGTGFAKDGGATTGTILAITKVQGDWFQLDSGKWIFAALCTQIPPSIYEAPEGCNDAKVLDNGDQVDWIVGERGERIDVTILNTTTDLCEENRVIWDGAAIRQDRLAPEGQRHPFERDFTGWWQGEAHYAGVSCALFENVGNVVGGPLTVVRDYNGDAVDGTHGVQVFEMHKGRWYLAKCFGTFNPGFRINKEPWTRP